MRLEGSQPSVCQMLEGHLASILSVVLSPDCRYLASGGSDSTISIWSVSTGEELVRMVYLGINTPYATFVTVLWLQVHMM